MTKKKILEIAVAASVGVVLLLVLGRSVTLPLGSPVAPSKDCGSATDSSSSLVTDCIWSAAQACTRAKGTVTYPSRGDSVYTEVQGGTPESCRFYVKISNSPTSNGEATCAAPGSAFIQSASTLCTYCAGSLVDDMRRKGLC